jgi:hypothetical protein
MSTDVTPYRQSSLADRKEYAQTLSSAGDLLPRGLWAPVQKPDGSMGPAAPSPGKVLLVLETAAMLGLDPMAGLQGIHVIEGKASLSAALMSAVIRAKGFTLRVTSTGSVSAGDYAATATLVRPDDPEHTYSATWNVERATRAGLMGKDNWKKYFEAMAKARAISEVCREGAEDVLLGVHYTPEELESAVDAGELRPHEEPSAPTTDWAARINEAPTAGAVKNVWRSIPDAERTDELQTQTLARGGALRRAEETAEAAPAAAEEAPPADHSEPAPTDAPASSTEDIVDAELVEESAHADPATGEISAEEYDRIEAEEFARWQASQGGAA